MGLVVTARVLETTSVAHIMAMAFKVGSIDTFMQSGVYGKGTQGGDACPNNLQTDDFHQQIENVC